MKTSFENVYFICCLLGGRLLVLLLFLFVGWSPQSCSTSCFLHIKSLSKQNKTKRKNQAAASVIGVRMRVRGELGNSHLRRLKQSPRILRVLFVSERWGFGVLVWSRVVEPWMM